MYYTNTQKIPSHREKHNSLKTGNNGITEISSYTKHKITV